MKRLFLTIFSFFVLFLIVLFFFRLPVTTLLFNKGLTHAGFANVKIEVTALSPTRIKLSDFNLSREKTGLNLSVKDITICWNKTSLFSKRLESINIDTVTITLPHRDREPAHKDLQIAELVGKLQDFTRQLPFRSLTIRHIVVDENENEKKTSFLAGKPISLAIKRDKDEQKLVADLHLEKPALHISIKHDGLQRWDIKIKDSGGAVPVTPLLWANITLQEEKLHLKAEAELSRLFLLDPLLAQPLPAMAGMLSIETIQPLPLTGSRSLQVEITNLQLDDFHSKSVVLTVHGEMITPALFSITEDSYLNLVGIKHKDTNINKLKFNLTGAIVNDGGLWQYRLAKENKLSVEGISAPPLKIASLSVTPAISMGFSPEKEQVSVKISPYFRILSTGIRAGELSLAEVTISLEKESNLYLNLPTQTWNLTPSLWQISVDGVNTSKDGLSINSAPLILVTRTISGAGAEYQINGKVISRNADIKTIDNGFALSDLDIKFKITNIPEKPDSNNHTRINSSFSFSPATVPGRINGKLSHNLKTETGKVTARTQDALSFSAATPLSSLIDNWPIDIVDLNGGKLDGKAVVKWQPDKPVHLFVESSLEDGAGTIKGTGISGISLSHALNILPAIRSQRPGKIHIKQIESVVKIKNIETAVTLFPSPYGELPVIHMDELTMETLGGRISGKNLTFDSQHPNLESELTLHNIDLYKLARIQRVKGLNIQGRIHGTLPFRFDNSGLHIDNGVFSNKQTKGVIRYTPDGADGLRDSPLTGYALLALEEFHYHLLGAHAQYSPDGTLLVRLRLEGTSPKLETNRPVHLNINTEQNILSLLESLRYSKQMTREIEEKLHKH